MTNTEQTTFHVTKLLNEAKDRGFDDKWLRPMIHGLILAVLNDSRNANNAAQSDIDTEIKVLFPRVRRKFIPCPDGKEGCAVAHFIDEVVE